MVLETHQETVAEKSQPKIEPDTPLQAERGADTVPLYTPLTRAPADNQDLRNTREILAPSVGKSHHTFAVDINTAKALIDSMSQANLSALMQIAALTRTHDENGNLLESAESRIAFAKRIHWNLAQRNVDIAPDPEPSEEVCILYGQCAFGLTANQMRVMRIGKKEGYTISHETLDIIRNQAGLSEICDFFRHDDFEEDPPYPHIFSYRRNREITMWGNTYHIEKDEGTKLEIFGPDRTSTFSVPKWVVERYNKYSRLELITGATALVVEAAAHTMQMGMVMVNQVGALHPAYLNGRLTWVLEPWARIAMDETDENNGAHHFSADNKYTGLFEQMRKERGNKRITITAEDMAGLAGNTKGYATDIPTVAVVGLSLKMVDHHRINGALSANTPIEVFLHFGDISFR